jgi:predicted RNA-binding Zn-ribbon protein involved in translation (DUF1610 family)
MRNINEWEQIFNAFLEDDTILIPCPNCEESIIKFTKINQGNRLFIHGFCEECGFSQDSIRVVSEPKKKKSQNNS